MPYFWDTKRSKPNYVMADFLQKTIYGCVSAPKKSIGSRGKMGLMFKNKVETSFNQSHEDLLVTTGAVIKAAGRSTIIIKNDIISEPYVYITITSFILLNFYWFIKI